MPVDKLYLNPNLMTLLFDRGGHTEFCSGWKAEPFAQKIIFEFFENVLNN